MKPNFFERNALSRLFGQKRQKSKTGFSEILLAVLMSYEMMHKMRGINEQSYLEISLKNAATFLGYLKMNFLTIFMPAMEMDPQRPDLPKILNPIAARTWGSKDCLAALRFETMSCPDLLDQKLVKGLLMSKKEKAAIIHDFSAMVEVPDPHTLNLLSHPPAQRAFLVSLAKSFDEFQKDGHAEGLPPNFLNFVNVISCVMIAIFFRYYHEDNEEAVVGNFMVMEGDYSESVQASASAIFRFYIPPTPVMTPRLAHVSKEPVNEGMGGVVG